MLLNYNQPPPAFDQTACSIRQVEYVLRGTPAITATAKYRVPTRDFPSNVEIDIKSHVTGNLYKLLPFVAGSELGVKSHFLHLDQDGKLPKAALVNYDEQDMLDFIVADRNYSFSGDFLMKMDSEAPKYILIPELQVLFWYGNPDRREYIPMAFLDRVCPSSQLPKSP